MKTLISLRMTGLFACAAIVCGLLISSDAQAQSGRKAPAKAGSMKKMQPEGGSMAKSMASKPMMTATLGMDGYCPVCIVAGKGWVKGDERIQSTYDGKVYYFPSAEVKQMFDADPVKYTPALGGDCTVCLKAMGKRVPGSVHFSTLLGDRLFLFPDEGAKQKFDNNPNEFMNVDLAANGDCTVCRVEMQQRVAGSPDFAVMHKGKRYQFPGADQMKMFSANPAKYEVAGGGMMAK